MRSCAAQLTLPADLPDTAAPIEAVYRQTYAGWLGANKRWLPGADERGIRFTGWAPCYWKPMVRRLVASMALSLLEEPHIDGSCVDQTRSIHPCLQCAACRRPPGAGGEPGGAKLLREWKGYALAGLALNRRIVSVWQILQDIRRTVAAMLILWGDWQQAEDRQRTPQGF